MTAIRVQSALKLVSCALIIGASGCSSDGSGSSGAGGSSSKGGASAMGGASALGGSPASNGGSPPAQGGATGGSAQGGSAASSGGSSGTANGGSAGSAQSGGSNSAGGTNSGGTSNGGSASGGVTSGGSANGGRTNGGSSNGGNSNAGAPSTGGSSSGGATGSGGGTSSSCPSTALSPGNSSRTISVGGKSRSYVLHVPSGYTGKQAVPLIIDFHPLGGSGPSEQSGSPYPKVVDAENVVMAFPTGLAGPSGNAWNVGPCCVDNVDDVEFARALVTELKTLACVDPKRVYAVGFSMGGGMSHYLACHAADVFAAVAPAAFDLLQENAPGCKPSRPITVISFRGTSDGVVPYNGGASNVVSGHPVTFLGAVNTMKKWAEINQCSGSAADLGGGCQGYAASQCKDGVEVILCTKQGGGHEAGNATTAWPVLKRHPLP
ncbi:MAG: alpha/beta hydrolase family esterase [Myxococcota bacterium]